MAKTLMAYFSLSGVTKKLAETAAAITGADMYEISAEKPYPENNAQVIAVSRVEAAENARPALAKPVPDISGYDVILLGFPNWISTCPMAVLTFCEALDFSGKKVLPFITHGGVGKGHTDDDLKRSCAGAKLAPCADGNDFTEESIREWLSQNNVI